jgi:outer membrane receptor protein involved in Fe transport
VIPEASVTVYRVAGIPLMTTTTDKDGRFALVGVPRGRFELLARFEGFEPASAVVDTSQSGREVVLVLRVGAVVSSVTVTGARGLPEESLTATNSISSLGPERRLSRPALILPQELREEPGVQVQQTSTHQGAVIVRGLTGQQVLHLVDGVRYNNSTFRPGPNQYLATIDPSFVERIEISRGPSSTLYGSDSLGGTLNFLPARPEEASSSGRFRGEWAPFFRSADWAGGSSLRLSYGTARMHVLGGGSFRRGQDLRAGKGGDSHAAVTRFLGLPSSVLGNRLQDTAFSQWAAYARFFANLRANQTVSFTYHRGEQLGGRRYDQLNGGNGNLINSFAPQTLDLFYARYEKQGLGWLDTLSATFSVNRQRDDRRSQGGSGNALATITSEQNVTTVFGYQAQAATHIGAHQIVQFGGEVYDEFISSQATTLNPVTSAVSVVRARFPDGSRYTSYGLFGQHSTEWFGTRLRTQAGVRFSGIRFRTFAEKNPLVGGIATVPDFSTTLHDVTFQLGSAFRVSGPMSLFATFARGFRAPNASDYSTVGLSSNGFEVSPSTAASHNALLGSSAGASAVSTGRRVTELVPEALWDIEGGARLSMQRVFASFTFFQYSLKDFITRRAILLPAGAVGQSIGGVPIVSQLSSGAVITSADPRPVISRANVGRVRMRGIEAEGRAKLASVWSVQGNFTWLRGVDRETGGPPDVEGGIPPMQGFFALRWQRSSFPFWAESYVIWADKQDRLSSLELNDQRVGAIRTRTSISSYFNNGAVARGLVQGGILLPTGETLAQVQDRVLGVGIQSAPFFSKMPGFATLNFRGGYRTSERSEIVWVLENVLDKNYRVHGSGVDGAGRNLQLSYFFRF